MKSTILLLSAVAFALALGSMPALGQQAEREVTSINRHQLIAAKELEHFRLYEQTTHPTVDDSGTFLLGSGGSASRINIAVTMGHRAARTMRRSNPFAMRDTATAGKSKPRIGPGTGASERSKDAAIMLPLSART